MKKTIILVAILFNLSTVVAQEWEKDFETAKEIASEDNKPIILVFQGSDWCAPCIKLDREIWSTDIFKSYAKNHFVMLKADFPKRKKNALTEEQQTHNNKLAEIYNKGGYFPYIVILDKNGGILGSTGYKKTTPQEYINLLKSFNR